MHDLAYDFETVPLRTASKERSRVIAQLLSATDCAGLIEEWRDLEMRAIEPNPFFSPAFMLAAGQHLRESGVAHFIVIRDGDGSRRLLGLFPVRATAFDQPGAVLRGWTSPYSAFGAPLVDRDRVDEVVRAFLAIANDHLPRTNGYLFQELDAQGPLACAMERAAGALGLPMARLSPRSRAVLAIDPAKPAAAMHDRKLRKEMRRYRRRLEERGATTFRLVSEYDDVREALERFLALEASGWKGKRGTALIQTPGRANFTRSMIWSLARQGRIRVACLDVAGEMVAGMLILMSGERGYLWKIAYDEAYAACSPGVLLIEDTSQAFMALGYSGLLDSCAQQGSRMIENLWSGRIILCDLMIGLDPRRQPAFRASLAREQFRRSLRARVKTIYRRLRGWEAA